jgi:hypothetical protein
VRLNGTLHLITAVAGEAVGAESGPMPGYVDDRRLGTSLALHPEPPLMLCFMVISRR